jgi:hypothetical protein
MLLQLGFLQHEPKIQKAPVENESLSWYFVSSLKAIPKGMAFRLLTNPIIFDGVCFWVVDFQSCWRAAAIC